MSDPAKHAANKRAVVDNLRALFTSDDLEAAVAKAYMDEAELHAFHPVNDQLGVSAIASELWAPIRESFPDAERRDQILLANEFEGRDYVAAVSVIQGTFAKDWLGIPATHGVATLRCCEINRVVDGKIKRAYVLIDVLDLMFQAGCWPLSPSLGEEGCWEAPATNDGVQPDHVDLENGAKSREVVRAMHAALLSFDGKDLGSMDHAKYWTPDFLWYGPAGIGTTRGLSGFETHHQIPFLRAFPDRKGGLHVAQVADGNYVFTGGWPSVVATHTGPDWLNVGPTGRRIEMRVMDFYRLENGLLAENWVPIDIVNILLQMGVDVFARLKHLRGEPRRDL